MGITAVRRKAALGVAALAASVTTLGANAAASTQDLHVAVWGLDNALVVDATVAFEATSAPSKGACQPDGCYLVPNQATKGTLTVDHAVLGEVSFEVTLPERPLVEVDVIYVSPGFADLVLDQPTKRIRGREGFFGPGPINDLCQDAIWLEPPPIGDPLILAGTTLGATVDEGLPFCETAINSPGVWYRVVGSGTIMSASTCTAFFDYDTKISIFCADCAEPTCIAANDDNCTSGASGLLSHLDWCAQAGAEYLILVHGFGEQSGDFELQIATSGMPCEALPACIPTGACCLPNGECENGYTAEQCAAANGYYQGDGIACEGGFVEYLPYPSSDAEFFDITGIGTPLILGDDTFEEVPIGFTFPFFGDPITDIKVCSNGYLTTGPDGTDFTNDPCLDPTDPNSSMFVLWDDWSPNNGGQVHYVTTGNPGTRVFWAQWTDVPKFGADDVTGTFQVRFHEQAGTIVYCYASLNGVPTSPGDTTTGVEDETGLAGACVAEDQIAEGDCWAFFPTYQEPVYCPCRFLDFTTEDDFVTPLVNGQDISSPPEFGSLFLINGYGSGTPGLAVFDSHPAGPNAGGPDPDLLVDLGNIVILQSLEHPDQTVPGIYDVPDDASTGGIIEVEFLWAVEPLRLDLIDICEPDFYTQVFLWDDYGRTRTYAVPGGWTTDIYEEGGAGFGTLRLDTLAAQPGVNGTAATATQSPGFDPTTVEYMEIHLGNSGGIDNFEFCISPSDTPTGD